jgi:hypothetical protein
MKEEFGRKPLNEFVPLVSACPGGRGERVVAAAVYTQSIGRGMVAVLS